MLLIVLTGRNYQYILFFFWFQLLESGDKYMQGIGEYAWGGASISWSFINDETNLNLNSWCWPSFLNSGCLNEIIHSMIRENKIQYCCFLYSPRSKVSFKPNSPLLWCAPGNAWYILYTVTSDFCALLLFVHNLTDWCSDIHIKGCGRSLLCHAFPYKEFRCKQHIASFHQYNGIVACFKMT